jgi:D-amino-acid oxidase
MSLPESIIVNCTGLGSKIIFNDQELIPIKGQYTICVPQPEVNYRVFGPASINPRRDGLLIGNMMERGNGSLEPNLEVSKQNMEAAIRFVGAMRGPRVTSLSQNRSRRDLFGRNLWSSSPSDSFSSPLAS